MSAGDQDLVYRIKTVGEFQALERAQKELQSQVKATKDLGKASDELERHLKAVDKAMESGTAKALARSKAIQQATAAIAKVGGDTRGLMAENKAVLAGAGLRAPGMIRTAASAFGDAGGGLGGIRAAAGTMGASGGLIGAALLATIGTATKGLREFASAEEGLFARNAALKQRGQDTAEYKKQLDGLVDTMEDATGVDNDRWTKALTTAIQSGASPENIANVAKMIENAAGLPQMFGNVESASEAVSKAINGQFDAFTRLGFIFTENADQAQKMDELMRQLATRGGGQLAASTETLNGQFRKLKNSFSSFLKEIGKGQSETGAVQDIVYGLSTSLEWLTGKLKAPQKETQALTGDMKGLATEMQTAEQKAAALQTRLEGIKKSAEEASKKREAFSANLSKESQDKIDVATDSAAFQTAKVDTAERMGLLTPQQAEARRRGIKNGLEQFKQKTASEDIQKEINSRKMQIDEGQSTIAGSYDKVREEEARLEQVKKLKAEEDHISGRFNTRMDRAKLEAEKRFLQSNGSLEGGVFSEEQLKEVVAQDPEVQKIRREKGKALSKFHKENGPLNVSAQEDVVARSRAIADAQFEANMSTTQTAASEIREFEERRARMQGRFQTQNATTALSDFSARLPERGAAVGTTAVAGGVREQIAGAFSPLNQNGNFERTFMAEVMQTLREQSHVFVERARQGDPEARRMLEEVRRDVASIRSQMRNGPGR